MARLALAGTLVLAALSGTSSVRAESLREVVYNRVSRTTSDLDRVVDQTYGRKYDVRPIPENDPDYAPPQVVSGKLPTSVLDAGGKAIKGYALLLYLIKSDGSVADPVVVKSTDVRFEGPAKSGLLRARFRAATWHGKSVSTVAAQEFNFDGQ